MDRQSDGHSHSLTIAWFVLPRTEEYAEAEGMTFQSFFLSLHLFVFLFTRIIVLVFFSDFVVVIFSVVDFVGVVDFPDPLGTEPVVFVAGQEHHEVAEVHPLVEQGL